ncbi:MAG: hypothetical protein R2831_07350 [Chitinophagaceae bacterium]
MKFNNHKALAILVAVLFTFSLYSCKENTILPSDLIPEVDNIYTFRSDTNTLKTYNIIQDSLQTGGTKDATSIGSLSTFYHAIGTILADPVFGKTVAYSHVEVLPPNTNFSFKTNFAGTSRTIDSIILSIPYRTAYGDTFSNTTQSFSVFRSLKRFPRDSTQYDFTRDVYDAAMPLATRQVNFSTISFDTTYGTAKQLPTIHFKMPAWFIDSVQAQVDSGANGAASNYSNFLNWWNGFVIIPDSNNGNAMGYFDTYNTKMKIHYRYTNTLNKLDTVVDVFGFDPSNCNRFNAISRNTQGSISSQFLLNGENTPDSILGVQAEPGFATLLKFPYLYQFNNVLVNKADLIFTAVSPYYNWTDTTNFGLTPQLQILKTINGVDKLVEDYALFGLTYVNGNKKVYTLGGFNYIQYKFSITQSIQQLISQKDSTFNFKIIGVKSGLPASSRVLLLGSESQIGALKPRLDMIYTRIDK